MDKQGTRFLFAFAFISCFILNGYSQFTCGGWQTVNVKSASNYPIYVSTLGDYPYYLPATQDKIVFSYLKGPNEHGADALKCADEFRMQLSCKNVGIPELYWGDGFSGGSNKRLGGYIGLANDYFGTFSVDIDQRPIVAPFCSRKSWKYNIHQKNFCRLASPATEVGTINLFGTAYGSTLLLGEDDKTIPVRYNWTNDNQNCDLMKKQRIHLVRVNGDPISGTNASAYVEGLGNEGDQQASFTDFNGVYYGLEFSLLQVGTYDFEISIQGTSGQWYGPFTKTLTVVPDCYFEGDVQSAIDNLSPFEENEEFTSYILNSGEDYVLRFTGITRFNNYYTFSNDFGNNIQAEYLEEGVYKLTLNTPVGSFNAEAIKKSILDAGNGETFCGTFIPIKFFVGGSDLEVERPCLIVLPDDMGELFNTSDQGWIDFSLQHFTFTVKSYRGVIVNPGVTLERGAVLEVEPIVSPDLIDNDMNWTQTISYDDRGQVISENKSFFSQEGELLQSQVKNLTDELIMASNPLYDRYGRAVGQTLIAPIRGKTVDEQCEEKILAGQDLHFVYKGDFITSGGQAYDFSHFDRMNIQQSAILDDEIEGTLGWYYGPNNTVENIMDSEFNEGFTPETNYPFIQSLFRESDGELISQVPAGDVYRGVTSHENIGKTEELPVSMSDPDLVDYLQIRSNFVVPNHLVDYSGKLKLTRVTDQQGRVSEVIATIDEEVLITRNLTTTLKSYSFYDGLGRVLVAISPNGVTQYKQGVPYSQLDKTTYEYNYKGQLKATTEPDVGRTEFKYRRDGLIRFTQNALQRKSGRYSYVEYDVLSRVIESGEYDPESNGPKFNELTLLQLDQMTSLGTFVNGKKYEVVHLVFDKEQIKDLSQSIDRPLSFEQNFGRGKLTYSENENTKSWYNYDERGRLLGFVRYYSGWDTFKAFEYRYNASGSLEEVAYQRGETDAFYHYYTYDADLRLEQVYTSSVAPTYGQEGGVINSTSLTKQAHYYYYKHGPLKRVELGDKVQGIDYVYTIEGWLKSINNPNTFHYFDPLDNENKESGVDIGKDKEKGFGQDAFSMALDYYNGDYLKAGSDLSQQTLEGQVDRFNGVIKTQSWRTSKHLTSLGESPLDNETFVYAYQYDDRYQLIGATHYGSSSAIQMPIETINSGYEVHLQGYDGNGNLLGLSRKDEEGNLLHSFSNAYVYGNPANDPSYKSYTNQLTSILGYADYEYDEIGQLIKVEYATGAAISQKIVYRVDGLVKEVQDLAGVTQVSFKYDDKGDRIYKKDHNNGKETWYVRGFAGKLLGIYTNENEETPEIMLATPSLKEVMIHGISRLGTYKLGTQTSMQFELKDHLGNVRGVVEAKENENKILLLNYSDYYPLGLVMNRYTDIGSYRYAYQGEYSEDETEQTGYNSFTLRQYDPVIGRWISVDPEREFPSPYVGMGNSPVNYMDPTGGAIDDIIFINSHGKEVGRLITEAYDRTVLIETDKEIVYFEYELSKLVSGPVHVVGLGIEGSASMGPGAHYGMEWVLFLAGKDAFTVYTYHKGGVNAGLEGGVGYYVFAANWKGDVSKMSHKDWYGWFYGYTLGAGDKGYSYFWGSDGWLEVLPGQTGNITWQGVAYSPWSKGIISAPVTGKYSASYYTSGFKKKDDPEYDSSWGKVWDDFYDAFPNWGDYDGW